ncbi:MAG: FAD-binding protein [Bacteroidetes bacterium]|jgi:glycolate oxidase|nr:FAD-binding protein [Bacteroidota bacterium]
MELTDFSYAKVQEKDVLKFREILDEKRIKRDESSLIDHSKDETEDISILPEVVLEPKSSDEISKIMRHCQDAHIPVTVRGAGTGLSGGAIPAHGGVALSMRRMNKILNIDENNFMAIVQPGVITQELQDALKEKDLFYPPDPASKGSCYIGGNIAENSGGPKAVKYGVVKDYVLNLEVVLPSGDIIRTGSNTLKNATGYNLTQLMVGSEGTLGVVTEIVLKLIPHPRHTILMLAPFRKLEEAAQAVPAIMKAGITPSGLEFMERAALDAATRALSAEDRIPISDEIEAQLLIELDGNYPEVLMEEAEKIYETLNNFDCGEILMADSEAQKERLWKMRRIVGEAVKRDSIYKEEDTVVPRFAFPELLKSVKEIGEQHGFESVCYGHAGDGNLHVNILKGQMSEKEWNEDLPIAIRSLFEKVKSLGGTISGEHGIGWVQKNYMDVVFSEVELELMKSIKAVFDPKGILNPGKIFPT